MTPNDAIRRLNHMEEGIKLLLTGMLNGNSWQTDPNFMDTPRRVSKMFMEMLSPQENNWTAFPAQSADMVVLRNHKVIALCPHHLQPVEVKCFIGYIPNKTTIGLSKLARVVEQFLTIPIMQEDLANAVANELNTRLDPRGVGVVLSGIHGCMRFRGVESDGDVVTSVMKGQLLLNPAAREEFFHIIGRP
jgi:GTP cyclohydrolase I